MWKVTNYSWLSCLRKIFELTDSFVRFPPFQLVWWLARLGSQCKGPGVKLSSIGGEKKQWPHYVTFKEPSHTAHTHGMTVCVGKEEFTESVKCAY